MVYNLNVIQMVTIMMSLQHRPEDRTITNLATESVFEYLKSNLKPSVLPCTNFQEYACGNFESNSQFSSYGTFQRDKPKLYTSTHNKRYEQVDETLLTMLKSREQDNKAIEMVKTFFGKCTNVSEIYKTGDEILQKELKRVGVAPDFFTMWANIVKFSTVFNNFFIFRINVMEDLHNRGSYVPLILVTPECPVGLYATEHVALPNLRKYFERIYSVTMDDYMFSATLDFWKRIKQIVNESELETNENYERVTLSDLQDQTHEWITEAKDSSNYDLKINWENFFNKLFEDVSTENIDSDFVVYVSDMKKFKNIVQLLACVPFSVIGTILFQATVLNVLPMGPEQLQKGYFEERSDTPEEQMCLTIIKDSFRSVVAYKLLENVTNDDKETVYQLVKMARKALIYTVDDARWLSKQAKISVSNKIKNLQVHIPYRDVSENDLDDVYAKMIDTENLSFYDSYLHILQSNRKEEFGRIFHSRVKPSRLEFRPPVDLMGREIVKYYPLSNEIEMSIVLFEYPYYYGSSSAFFPLNAGSLGFHLVRQMVHALDDFLENPTSPWTDDDKSTFFERMYHTTKLINRTENYSQENDEKRWKMAQLEAVADDTSIHVCVRIVIDNYSELFKSSEVEIGMPELLRTADEVTVSQFMMLSLAMTMCKKPAPPKTTYINSPNRINELFKHSKQFQFIWDCFDGDSMMVIEENEYRMSLITDDIDFKDYSEKKEEDVVILEEDEVILGKDEVILKEDDLILEEEKG